MARVDDECGSDDHRSGGPNIEELDDGELRGPGEDDRRRCIAEPGPDRGLARRDPERQSERGDTNEQRRDGGEAVSVCLSPRSVDGGSPSGGSPPYP